MEQQRTAWFLYEYHNRFELRDDSRKCRKSGLVYIQVPVGTGDADAHLEDLEYEPNYCELLGAYIALARRASKRSRAYRGWLLVGPYRPAEPRHIERWLKMPGDKAKAVMAALERLGLIVRRPLPNEWDLSENEDVQTTGEVELDPPSAEYSRPTGADLVPGPLSADHGDRVSRGADPEDGRADVFFDSNGPPEISGKFRPLINGHGHGNRNGNGKEMDWTAPPSGAEPMENPAGQPTESPRTARTAGPVQSMPTAQAPQGLKPTKADGSGADRGTYRPPRTSQRSYSKAGAAFAELLLERFRYVPSSRNDRIRQVANFAHLWDHAVEALPTEMIPGFERAALKKPTEPDVAGKSAGFLRKCLNNLLADWRRKL